MKDGTGQTLHRRLFVVESADGAMALRQPTVFLDVVPARGAELPNVPAPSRSEVERFLLEEALERFLEEVQDEREREVEAIARHVELSLNVLIARQQVQVDQLFQRRQQGEDVSLALQEAERRLDDLNERLERRRQELESERRFTLADLAHLGAAWVLPHPEREGPLQGMVSDPAVEAVAMAEAMAYERGRGWEPEDVSAENRGFDILSRDPERSKVRFIEVKGRAGTAPIALTANEYRTAQRLGGDHFLYAVFDCATTPRLLPVEDPARLGWEPVVRVEHYVVGPEAIEEAVTG